MDTALCVLVHESTARPHKNEGTPPSMSWRGPALSWCDESPTGRSVRQGPLAPPRAKPAVGPPVAEPRLLSVAAARYRVRMSFSTPTDSRTQEAAELLKRSISPASADNMTRRSTAVAVGRSGLPDAQ